MKEILPSLVKFGTNAYPLKSLSGVLDCVSNATVKSQWPRQSIQVVEELCNDKDKDILDVHSSETSFMYESVKE